MVILLSEISTTHAHESTVPKRRSYPSDAHDAGVAMPS